MTKLPNGPWQRLAMDISGPFENKYYLLVVTDYYSRFPLVEIITSTTSQTIISHLRKWFHLLGFPYEIRSDNAQNMVSAEMESFFKQNGIKHSYSMPFFPRQNGEVERFNRSLKKCVQTAVAENKNWRIELQTFLLHYRATKHATTNVSPAELLFNRSIKTKLPEMQQCIAPAKLRARDKRQKEKIKFHANKNKQKSYRKFSVGQPVLILKQEKGKVLQTFENNIYRVISQNCTSLKLQSKSGGIRYRNVCHVRPYFAACTDHQQTVSHGNMLQKKQLRDRQTIKMPVRFRDGGK